MYLFKKDILIINLWSLNLYELSLRVKFPERRQKLVDLVIRCLEDKASIVHKNAIKLLYQHILIVFCTVKEWEKRLNKVEEELKVGINYFKI